MCLVLDILMELKVPLRFLLLHVWMRISMYRWFYELNRLIVGNLNFIYKYITFNGFM